MRPLLMELGQWSVVSCQWLGQLSFGQWRSGAGAPKVHPFSWTQQTVSCNIDIYYTERLVLIYGLAGA